MAAKPPKPKTKDARQSAWALRFAHFHARLLISIVLGIAIFLVLPGAWPRVPRMLLAWDAGLLIYLVAAFVMMARATDTHLKEHSAAQEDEGAFALLFLTVGAVAVSLVAIFVELAGAKNGAGGGYGLRVALAIATVLLSWLFTHTIFALHYAYDFYGDGHRAKGLQFPDDNAPDYWDFIYFSMVIGMTFQVSDVQVTNKGIRRLVVAHGLVSFLFNTAVVALTVNMAANAL
jgi:uncharacterized membrane protein